MRIKEEGKCVFCGGRYFNHGHDPWPIKTRGRCCTKCNWTLVLPKRAILFGEWLDAPPKKKEKAA